jgi:UDP-GlcNAc:undecaprenyl-phosphate/decaprenyl-phosphate GlcNAc-1-phosphate transferase
MTPGFLAVGIIASFLANLSLTPLAIRIAHRYGFLDHPGNRKIHDRPIPRLGGVAILFSMVLGMAAALALFHPVRGAWVKLAWILGATLGAALLGFWDDHHNLRPRLKFLLQALIAGTFVLSGYRFESLHIPGLQPIPLGFVAAPLTVFWIMSILNGLNFMDGLDGLAGSVTAVSFAALGAGAVMFSDPAVGLVCLCALGALLAFLFFNWRPAKVYMGNVGSNILGILLPASLVALAKDGPHGGQPFNYQILLCTLLAAYPALEVALSAGRRGVKKFFFGRSMEWSEREHIHHRLLKIGFKPGQICLVACLFNLSLAGSALLIIDNQKADGIWLLLPAVLAMTLLMRRMGFFDFLSLPQILKQQPHYLIAHHFINMQRSKLRLAHTPSELMMLVNQTCLEFNVIKYLFQLAPGPGRTAPLLFHWESPFHEHQDHLNRLREELSLGASNPFKDRAALEGDRAEAFWFFEPYSEETDLDVEYRVLMNGFMESVLRRLLALGPSPAHLPVGTGVHEFQSRGVASITLRRRSPSPLRPPSPELPPQKIPEGALNSAQGQG